MSETVKPLLVSGPKAREILGIGNTKYFELLKEGVIETVKVGSRRFPTYASLERLAQPETKGRRLKRNRPQRYQREGGCSRSTRCSCPAKGGTLLSQNRRKSNRSVGQWSLTCTFSP